MSKQLTGIIIAMESEMKPILEMMTPYTTEKYLGREYYCSGKAILVQSDIGEIGGATAVEGLLSYANSMRERGAIEKILNVGLCGSLRRDKYKVGDVLLVRDVCHYDFDISEIDNVKRGVYPGRNTQFFELDISPEPVLASKLGESVKIVRCASGDKFISDENIQRELINEFDADICEMELAGIAIAADRHKIPVVSIKAVSDSAGEATQQDDYYESKQKIVNNYIDAAQIILQQNQS